MASFEDAYKEYEKSNRGQTVAGMYDKQRDAELASLESAYKQNLSNREAARDQIGTTYQGQANDLATQYERNRRNLNTQAAANGINTGTGSQQRLALNSNYQRDYGALRGREAQDMTEANRGISDLTTAYQNAVQQANATGDYKKMAALLQDYQSERQRQLQDAQLMASYGIFDGYRDIYGDDTVNTMRNLWIAQNPLLAYNTGAIDANRYYQMTGQYAPGVTPPAPTYSGPDLTWVPQSNTNNLTDKSGDNKTGSGGSTSYSQSEVARAVNAGYSPSAIRTQINNAVKNPVERKVLNRAAGVTRN